MRRYYAKKELSNNDWKTQLAKGYRNIPQGAEVQFQNIIHNLYGVYATVIYEGILYYVDPNDLECKED